MEDRAERNRAPDRSSAGFLEDEQGMDSGSQQLVTDFGSTSEEFDEWELVLSTNGAGFAEDYIIQTEQPELQASSAIEMQVSAARPKLKTVPPIKAEILQAYGVYMSVLLGILMTHTTIIMASRPYDSWSMMPIASANGWILLLNWFLTATVEEGVYVGSIHWIGVIAAFPIASLVTGIVHGPTSKKAVSRGVRQATTVLVGFMLILGIAAVAQGADIIGLLPEGIVTGAEPLGVISDLESTAGPTASLTAILFIVPILWVLLFLVLMIVSIPANLIGRLFYRRKTVRILYGTAK